MKRIALFFAVAVAAIACTPEENVTPELAVVPAESELVLPTEGGELTIQFTTNVDWRAEVKEAEAKEWCSLSPASGKPGENTLKVIALENEGTENRTVTVVLKALELTQEIVVTQLQKDALVLSGKKVFEVAYQGENLEFAVSHNSELKATADVDWITEVKAKAVEESKLTFAVAPNTGEARTGKITFEAGSLKEVVEVQQAAWAFEWSVTPEETAKTFEAEGGEYEVTVAANVEYTVTVPENEWLTVADAEGVYTFTAAANTTPAAREVEVKIAPKDEKYAEAAVVVKMAQKGAGAKLEVSNKEDKWMPVSASTFEVTVDTNLEVEVSYSWDREGIEPWISYTEAAGVYTFAVAENPGWDLRSAYVNIVPVDEAYADLAVEVAVFQNGHASKMWSKQVTSYEGYDATQRVKLAKYGEYILLANTTKVYMLDPATGEAVGTIQMPEGFAAHNVLVDDAGNVLIGSDALDGSGNVTLFYVADPFNPVPEQLIVWNAGNYYCAGAGNIRVKGNVKEDAVITAVVTDGAGGACLAWEVVDGVIGDWKWTTPPYTNWNVPSLCFAPLGATMDDGFLYIGYGGDNNLYYTDSFVPSDASPWSMSYETTTTWEDNYNCISSAEWNGTKYAAILMGCHFNYYNAQMLLLNIDNPASATLLYQYNGEMDVERGDAWANLWWTGSGTYSDILLVPTADAMLMIGVDTNFGTIACIAIQ